MKTKKNSVSQRDVEFLFELGTLRNVERAWRQHLGVHCANVLEHTMRVCWLSLLIARRERVKDEEKIIKMALCHDIAETRVSDLNYTQKVYVQADEARAAGDVFYGTAFEDFNSEIPREYEERKSREARIVKDADNLDVDFELKELAERGSELPKKWKYLRKKVRDEKLYTKSAKFIWDVLQKSDPADWHLYSNKWLKMPNAGK